LRNNLFKTLQAVTSLKIAVEQGVLLEDFENMLPSDLGVVDNENGIIHRV